MQNMENIEVWKRSKKYPSIEVSNKGRVRKYLDFTKHTAGTGYYTIGVKNGKTNIQVLVHRLVAESFKGLDIDDTKMVVLHLDDDGRNNNEDNLVIGSQKDNVHDMIKKGKGNLKLLRKFNDEEVEIIKQKRLSGSTLKEIGEEFNVNLSTISRICSGRSYKN